MLLFTWKRTQGRHASQMLRCLTNSLVFNDFFLYCLFWHIVNCKVATDYLVLCIAYIFTFNVKARRSWRGGGGDHYEIQTQEWLWGQLMSVHCGGTIPLHFNKLACKIGYPDRIMCSDATRGVVRLHDVQWRTETDLPQMRECLIITSQQPNNHSELIKFL